MKSIIYTSDAPAPIGPYSQAVKAGNMLYISGQIAIDPETQELKISDLEEETKQVMRNIDTLLRKAGFSFADIVKTTIFLSDMKHFGLVNGIYGSFFENDFPARETVAV